jgi:hypothetical protein
LVANSLGQSVAAAQDVAEAVDVLPDLVALSSDSQDWMYGWSIDTGELPGRKLLRLTSATGNAGDGAMEIRGGAPLPGGQQEVFQRIFNDMGGFRDVLAGTFTYHPTHGHTHFDDFALYNLRAVTPGNGVGDIIAAGDKTSFCLLDISQFEPGAGSAQYNTCTTTRQGISPGWADVYDKSLPDQWIDITGVPDGTYWLEVIADPDDNILEADETNNVERILIDLVSPTPDRYEANESFATATDFGLVGEVVEPDLSIHETGDDDYFKITAGKSGNIDIRIFFDHSEGDIDMSLYDGAHNLLDESASVDDMEELSVSAVAGQTFYVAVYGYAGATTTDYDLEINGPLVGDYNGDGGVGGADYVIWRKMENTSVASFTGADGNGDGFVDAADYQVWQANFGSVPGGSGSVESRAAQKGQSSQSSAAEKTVSNSPVLSTSVAQHANRRDANHYGGISSFLDRRLDNLLVSLLQPSPQPGHSGRALARTNFEDDSEHSGGEIGTLTSAVDLVFESIALR